MKKALNYLRSMRFGILLLALIGVCSVVGSLLPQGRGLPYYAENYPSQYLFIYYTRIHDIFNSWYFILLMVLLCVNLALCSLTRLRALRKGSRDELERAAALPDQAELRGEEPEKLRRHLSFLRCRERKIGDSTVFYKNSFGRYGSFLTHLSILLVVLVGAGALYLPKEQDRNIMPGETITLEDGSALTVESFSVNSGAKMDYTSLAHLTLPDGRDSGEKEIKVNYPLVFGPYKIYQWNFGTTGMATAVNRQTGEQRRFYLNQQGDEAQLDRYNGAILVALHYQVEDVPMPSSANFTDVVYMVYLVEDGQAFPFGARAGDAVQLGDWELRFESLTDFPGLRIKHTPRVLNGLLMAVFALMIVAMVITFFCQPAVVKVDDKGYAVGGPKPEQMRMELAAFLERERGEET